MRRLVALLLLLALPAHAQPVFSAETVGGPRSNRDGELFRPEGIGPFPAMVVLHGCDGVGPHYREWARRLRGWGYIALLVDSFRPRGVRQVCGHGLQVPPASRAQDAFRAAAWLRTRPDVLPGRIGVIGFSHGGWTVLRAVLADAVAAAGQPPFAVAVAYYPACDKTGPPLASDTLILIGSADDWTPSGRCERWAQAEADGSHRVELHVYPGALHGFDTTARRHRYVGHTVGGDPVAGPAAEAEVRGFLAARLLGPGAGRPR